MSPLELAQLNLTSPIVLAFALGVAAALLRSDIRLPEAASSFISAYLLLAIGLKGGVELRGADPGELVGPLAMTLLVGCVTPAIAFAVLRRFGRFSVPDAAGVAAHYGSVSIVTFTAAVAFATAAGRTVEGYLPTLVAALEVPGIIVALAIAQLAFGRARLGEALREVLLGKSIMLLLGGIVIGAIAGETGTAPVAPLFIDAFNGLLFLFLLDLGMVAGQRLADVRKAGRFLVAFALLAPIVFGSAGVALALLSGLSPGGAAVFGAMAGSASYVAAPAAVQVSLPAANPAYSLTASLGLTFPFNLVFGIPLYAQVASWLS